MFSRRKGQEKGEKLTRGDIERLLREAGSPDQLDSSGRNLEGIDLSSIDLTGANLSRTNLAHANLSGANLAGVPVHASRVFNQLWYHHYASSPQGCLP